MRRSTARLITVFLLFLLLTIRYIYPANISNFNSQIIQPGIVLANNTLRLSQNKPMLDESDVTILTNGLLIDGTGAPPVSQGAVVIQKNRILSVGPLDEIAVPFNAQIIDVAGATILPGIINAHTHNTHSPQTRRRFLENGVTSTCDLATTLDDMPHFDQEMTDEAQPAARGFRTGPMITAHGGYPSQYGFQWDYGVATPIEAAMAVQDLVNQGADMIKVSLEPWEPQDPWPVLGLKEVQAIVSTAQANDIPVRAHVQQSRMLNMALQAGVDAVEHVPLPFNEERTLEYINDNENLALDDYPELTAQLTQMAEQGIALVPTLSVGTCATYDMPGLETKAQHKMCGFQLEIVERFYDLGGTVALGNDYGNFGVERGMPLREMQLLQSAGLPPMAVIEASTHQAAQVCGQANTLGTLEPGKLADLVVINGNPLKSLEALNEIEFVIKDGQIAYTLDSHLMADQ